jgi:hypothetical protein
MPGAQRLESVRAPVRSGQGVNQDQQRTRNSAPPRTRLYKPPEVPDRHKEGRPRGLSMNGTENWDRLPTGICPVMRRAHRAP